MYISKIQLENIRCIDKLVLDLRSRASTNNSLLLLGNNGVGKSTILKCIALGLCDQGGASGLLTDMYGALVKEGESQGRIVIHLNSGRKEYQLVTTVTTSKANPDIERIKKTYHPPRFPWRQLFVCAYGPSRVMQGTNAYDEYAVADAVYSLFNYGWDLQNPELILRRRGWRDREVGKPLLQTLADVLMIKPRDIRLSRTGLTIRNRSGGTSSLGALADGHRSTINWILDLVGWTYLSGRRVSRGIVLIDEIENHLHPTWQRHILRLLAQRFPYIQFIATSHSPLPAAGIYEKNERGFRIGEAQVLRMAEDGRLFSEELPAIDGWRYDHILESSAFGTPSMPLTLEKALGEVEEAYSGPDSRKTSRFRRAMKELREVSASDAVALNERRVAEELDAELQTLLTLRTHRQ